MPTRTIIAISGKARHGKTTVAQMIKEIIEQEIPEINPGYWAKTVEIRPIASILKQQAYMLGWDGKKDERGRRFLQELSTPIKNYHGHDYYISSLYNRIVDDNRNYPNQTPDIVVIDDMRFKQEMDFLISHVNQNSLTEPKNLVFVRVDRDNFTSDLNAVALHDVSETDLDDRAHEMHLIFNDFGLDLLRNKVRSFLRKNIYTNLGANQDSKGEYHE